MASLQMCTCQLVLGTEGLCVPLPRSTGWSVTFFHGDFTVWGGLGVGVGWGVRPAPLPCPQIPCFTSKMRAIQLSSSGLDVACGAAQLRAQVAACPPPPSLQQTGRRLQGGGVRSAVSRDQLQALEALPRPCISIGQRDPAPLQVSTLWLS